MGPREPLNLVPLLRLWLSHVRVSFSNKLYLLLLYTCHVFLFWKLWIELGFFPFQILTPTDIVSFLLYKVSFGASMVKPSWECFYGEYAFAGSTSLIAFIQGPDVGSLQLLNSPFYLSCFLTHPHGLPHPFFLLGHLYKTLISKIYFYLTLRITGGLVKCYLMYIFFNTEQRLRPSSSKYRTKSRNGSIIYLVGRCCSISLKILGRLMKVFCNS